MTLLAYEPVPIRDIGEPLVDLSSLGFILEPVYFKEGLSTEPRMHLRKSVAEKLTEIQNIFGVYRFKIWDAFRPRKVQNALYERTESRFKVSHPEWDEIMLAKMTGTFVTDGRNPDRVPPHSTGGAIDLTLVDQNGEELDMGTGFDHFGIEAAPYYFEETGKDAVVAENRKMLREAMFKEGFVVDPNEWWHFDYGNQRWALELGKTEALYGEVFI